MSIINPISSGGGGGWRTANGTVSYLGDEVSFNVSYEPNHWFIFRTTEKFTTTTSSSASYVSHAWSPSFEGIYAINLGGNIYFCGITMASSSAAYNNGVFTVTVSSGQFVDDYVLVYV